ncbi:MAG: helix-turn-helix transcriptional regulator [Eubacteriaceae bacterium]|nr:helix-turn-helix transcriptional regulator [Eubacteriaceae bacterium]
MDFGYRLRYLRSKRHMSQKELAYVLDLSINAISQYETNKRFPDQKGIVNICRFFNVSADYILGLSDVLSPIVSQNDTEGKNEHLSSTQIAAINDLLEAFKTKN